MTGLPSDTVRYTSLDGLRGVAALVVLLHHLSMTIPSIALTYYPSATLLPVGSPVWWLTNTPLKVLTAGTEGVLVFFVLSGFVLALAPLRNESFDWVGYYPQRVARLYLPTLAALVLAAVLALLPRDGSAFSGPFLHGLADAQLGWGSLLKDASILFGSPFLVNPPMWSLVWEVWFSLLLPAFIAIALLVRQWWIAVLLGITLPVLGFLLGQDWLFYLPVFLVGVGLARGRAQLGLVADRIAALRWGSALWAVLLVAGILALICGWLWRGANLRSDGDAAVQFPISILGAALITVVCAYSPLAKRFLTLAPVAWLGRISFSLYLVHLPIVLAVAYLVGEGGWPLTVAIALPGSLAVAYLFYRWVERPSHLLAKRLPRMPRMR